MAYDRRIGYYELFNINKGYNVIEPESLVIEPFSHINLAFVNFGADYTLINEYSQPCHSSNSPIRVFESTLPLAGGHLTTRQLTSFRARVSNITRIPNFEERLTRILVASTHENRKAFINSVVRYLQDYHLDGVDLD
jgi:chitinase